MKKIFLILMMSIIFTGCANTKTTNAKFSSSNSKQTAKNLDKPVVDLLTRSFKYGVYFISTPNKSTSVVTTNQLYSKFKSYPVGTTVTVEDSQLGSNNILLTIAQEKGSNVLVPNPLIFAKSKKPIKSYPMNKTSLSKLLTIAENRRRNTSKLSSEHKKIYNSNLFPKYIQ